MKDRRDQFLIVEDEEQLAALQRIAFSRQGEVEIAYNGQEALEKVKVKYFDVIICDVGMPIMDGIEFYKKAVAFDPDIRKRIIFYTGLSEHIDFFEKEKVRYLTKPVPLTELKTVVSEVLGEAAAKPPELSQ